jgi:hypothetical protein
MTTGLNLLEAWLLDPAAPAPSPAELRRAGLAGYAYTVLPAGDAARAELRGDYLASLARHQRIRAELAPLVRAWSEAGVDVLFFKGFHLAEFVYPAPGARFHGDVDVVVRPGEVERARDVAVAAGWRVATDTTMIDKPYYHNVFTLLGPGGDACVDLHRWAIHSELPWTRVPRRITEAAWSASRERAWESGRIREMAPVDALLVGLVLQRCWGDRWRLKPHDPIDFRLLSRDVPRAMLVARARELGASGALAHFLERCDPDAGRLHLGAPDRPTRLAWDLGALTERGATGVTEVAAKALMDAPRWGRAALRILPRLAKARRTVAAQPDLTELLRSLTPAAGSAPGDSRRRYFAVRAAVHLSRLLPANPRGDCLVRSLAVYAELRRQGWPVRFVSGVRRGPGGVVGHAWVEMDGEVIPELCEPANRRTYHVNFVYPPED